MREFEEQVAGRLAALRGVLAVALGGSRARGMHDASSDRDFAIYYRGSFDSSVLELLGWPGEISPVGGWGGGVMNGGAHLEVDGRRVDVHYRNLDEVEFHLAEARDGRFRIEPLMFYVAGIPTYVPVGELALNVVLSGSLPKPDFPDALKASAPGVWMHRARMHLDYAETGHARRRDALATAGLVARASIEAAHARLAARGEWALNEKGILARAGLGHLKPTDPIGVVRAEIEAS